MQRAQLAIVRQVARVPRDRREVQTALPHQGLEAGMGDDPHVMAGGLQSRAQRHVRAHVTLGTDGDDSNAHVA